MLINLASSFLRKIEQLKNFHVQASQIVTVNMHNLLSFYFYQCNLHKEGVFTKQINQQNLPTDSKDNTASKE